MSRREVFMVNDPTLYVEFRAERVGRFKDYHLMLDPKNRPMLTDRGLIFDLYREQLLLMIARYSRGDDMQKQRSELVDKVLPRLIEYGKEKEYRPFDFSKIEEYQFALWTVSLALLLDAPQDQFDAMITTIWQSGEDALFDYLASARIDGHPNAKQLAHPTPYEALWKAIVNQDDKREAAVDTFLKTYYKGIKDVFWYDLHLKNNAGFFGYWCFELAAVVKLAHMDDQPFAQNIFYPRDLTDKRILRTWLNNEEGEADRSTFNAIRLERLKAKLETSQADILDFVRYAMETGDFSEEGKAHIRATLEDSSVFGDLFTPRNQKDPNAGREIAIALISGLKGMAQTYRNGIPGFDPKDPEGLWKQLSAQGMDIEGLLAELPKEFRDKLKNVDPKVVEAQVKKRMDAFSGELDQLLANEEADGEALMEGLEKLSYEYGFSIPEPDDEPDRIKKEVREELGKDLTNLRKGKEFKVSFDDLWQDKSSN